VQEPQHGEQEPQHVMSVPCSDLSAASDDATKTKDGSVSDLDLSVSTDGEADAHNCLDPMVSSRPPRAPPRPPRALPAPVPAPAGQNGSKARCRFRNLARDSSWMIRAEGLRQAEKSAQINAPTSPLPLLCGSGQTASHGCAKVCDDETGPTILDPSRHHSSELSAPVHSSSDGTNLPQKRALVRSAVSQWENMPREKVPFDHMKAWPFAVPLRPALLKSG